ncbi:MAG TPA: chromate efflux transporter [Pyrinomonadaceae bacterium]|nr:chromate efflux transporter [Pyrinomonadaceae bacterium]
MGEEETQENERQVGFAEAFWFWLKLGFISFGGPAGQIAIMHRELVEQKGWLSEERFLHALNFCMLLPGPEAQQLAIYIGWLKNKTLGGIMAGAFFVVPSIFILLILSYIYAAYGAVAAVAGVLNGFKPVVIAIVVEALFKIGKKALMRKFHFAVAAAAFTSIYFLGIPFPLIVLASAVSGMLYSKLRKKDLFEETQADNEYNEASGGHTRPNTLRTTTTLLTGIVLWAVPFIGLIAWFGYNELPAQEYRFFSVSALVTFGGAYAVLAYVTQAVTATPYNWITPAQAVDGLALAETTPGPLIMVLQFVGFMAGWNNPFGGFGPLGSGVIGAMITTYATFLPSFIFIFAGAPYVEKLRKNQMLKETLLAVTAAVVGVILNLALVFGASVLFPQDFPGIVDWFAAGLAIFAFLVSYFTKIGVVWAVLGCGLIGLAASLVKQMGD